MLIRWIFTLVPVLFFTIISMGLLNARFRELYGYYDLGDLTRDDWLTVGLTALSLVMTGVLFNLIGLTLVGGN